MKSSSISNTGQVENQVLKYLTFLIPLKFKHKSDIVFQDINFTEWQTSKKTFNQTLILAGLCYFGDQNLETFRRRKFRTISLRYKSVICPF